MKVTKNDLIEATKTNILNSDQVDRLWEFLAERQMGNRAFK